MRSTVLITGASRGIGQAIAIAFAKIGYQLVITCSKTETDLLALADILEHHYGAKVLTSVGDIADYHYVEQLLEARFGGIDVLVNNAGISYVGLLTDMSIEDWNRIVNTNLTSVFSTCKHAVPYMVRQQAGKIINISSVWGNEGASMEVAYSSSICLMMEMQWINSGSFHSGEYFHGPFEIVEKDVPFILLMNDGKTSAIDSRALTFLQRFDAMTTVVDTKDYGLSGVVGGAVSTYFWVYAEEISFARQHPLSKRRYMWKLEY